MISIKGNNNKEYVFNKNEIINNTIEIEFVNVTSYCWPGREFVLGSEDKTIQVQRGYYFPLSFITILCAENGYTVLFKTPFKYLNFFKKDDKIKIMVEYNQFDSEFKFEIVKHEKYWQKGLFIYKEWYNNNFHNRRPDYPLKNTFHIKRYFFNKDLCSKYLIHDKIILHEQWKKDNELVGIDNILLFDHAYNKYNKVRCGNINPLIGIEDYLTIVNTQIEMIKKEKVFVLAYFDPYIIENNSEIDHFVSSEVSMTDKKGNLIRVWDYKMWHPCLGNVQWLDFSKKYVKCLMNKLNADGIYLDELGNGTQYQCAKASHNHNDDQNTREKMYTKNILSICPNTITMCEFPIVDSSAYLYQGVLNDTRSVLDIYRFSIPNVKVYRMINCDYPIGNQYYEVNKAFFNGEGIWLDNDLNNEEWYSKEIIQRLKLQYSILKIYSHYFNSEETIPLVYYDNQIMINRFGASDDCICMIINTTQQVCSAYLKYKDYGSIDVVYSYGSNMIERNNEGVYIKILPHEVIGILSKTI